MNENKRGNKALKLIQAKEEITAKSMNFLLWFSNRKDSEHLGQERKATGRADTVKH